MDYRDNPKSLSSPQQGGDFYFAQSGENYTDTDSLRRVGWIVYAKPPFGSPDRVLAYLARYTHRLAIANSRLAAMDGSRIRFRWRDYRQGNEHKLMSLDASEFIRRFLLHCLPDGFHRIRHFGFLANGHRQAKLALIRRLLDQPAPQPDRRRADYRDRVHDLTGVDLSRCPCCGGTMRVIEILPPVRAPPTEPTAPDQT